MRAPRRPESHRASSGQVRIIGGHWKRTPIAVVDVPGLRPTPDRVRETLFNWLGQDLTGWRVLDLFAGTGALGLEAASRGASAVTMVEREPRAVQALQAVCARLQAHQVSCVQADAAQWLSRAHPAESRFDLILLDPPFGGGELAACLPAVAARLADHGLLYIEWGEPLSMSRPPLSSCAALAGFELHRQGRAGQVHYHLLRRTP